MLQLLRPICFLDIESTGVNRETDRIIELSICKVHPDGKRELKTKRFNPEMPIPIGASEVHGIYDKDVKNEPYFKGFASSILSFIEGCDIGGFNSNVFDVPMLYNEFARCGKEWDYTAFKMVDVGNLFKIQEPRTLSAAVKFYLNKDHEGAHGAEADTVATADIFFEQMNRYDLPGNIDELALLTNYGKRVLDLSGKFTYNEAGEIVFTFGKHKDQPAKEHLDFVQWMIGKDFPADTMKICYELMNYDVTDIDQPKLPF